MSNWRKRQALASDQNSWRGMGVDSALWTSIDRNAGNVNTALGGDKATTTTGIVTGLSFYNNAGISSYAAPPNARTIFVSDASNVLIAPATAFARNTGEIAYDNSMNCTGSGLVFSVGTFGAVNSVAGQDISGVQYAIINGGSGYTVGNTFGMGTNSPFTGATPASTDVLVTITSVTSTAPVQGRN